MAKRRPGAAIKGAGSKPLDTTPKTTEPPQQATETPQQPPAANPPKPRQKRPAVKQDRWEDRYRRHTTYLEITLIDELKQRAKQTGESVSALHNRALRELLQQPHNE